MRIDSDKEFNKPQCLKGSTNPYLFVDGYVEKVIFDLSNLELQRTGVYDCIIQGYQKRTTLYFLLMKMTP